MITKVYIIECEWDIGVEGKIFKTKSAAMRTLQKCDWQGLVGDNLENLIEEGLVSIKEVELTK